MNSPTVDLRSDTVTEPTDEMRREMAAAPVGDDVFGEDPTVAALEQECAEMLGYPAALFVPSGTMGNLVSILVHTSPGDELIIEENSHSFNFETGGAAAFGSRAPKTSVSFLGVNGSVSSASRYPSCLKFRRSSSG